MSAIEVGGAFLMGLMGSAHCLLMCGPIAAISCASDRRSSKSGIAAGLLPHAGRLSSYVVLGAGAGAAGGAVLALLPVSVLQIAVRILIALVLVLVGLYMGGWVRGLFSRVERAAAPVFLRLSRGGQLGATATASMRYVQGAVWGLLPCGLVYGALALAMLAGSAQRGALVLLAFGAGTLPAMVTAGFFAQGLRRVVADRRVRGWAGLLLAAAGTVHLSLGVRATLALDLQRSLVTRSTTETPPEGEEPLPVAPPSCH